MCARIFYTLQMAWRYRQALRRYQIDKNLQSRRISDLSLEALMSNGLKVLVIDFDGVLASHGEEECDPEFNDWLKSSIQCFGDGRVFILSNKPTESRSQYFLKEFQGIQFIKAPRKKPYPDGLNQVIEISAVKPHEMLVIDDRLLTGILGAEIVGARGCLITNPLVNIKKRPIVEGLFIGLRKLERWLL